MCKLKSSKIIIFIILIFLLLIAGLIGYLFHNNPHKALKPNVSYQSKISISDHLNAFNKDIIIKGPVSCALTSDNKHKILSECYEVSIFSITNEHTMGPWCPRTINDENAGYWFTDEKNIHKVTGSFFKDTNESNSQWWVWNLMKENGWDNKNNYNWKKEGNSFLEASDKTKIKYPKTADECLAGIIPDTDKSQYVPYSCQECLPENSNDWYGANNTNNNKYVLFNEDGNKVVLYTFLIPKNPVFTNIINGIPAPTNATETGNGIGVSLSGTVLEGVAPITIKKGILDLKTIVPFDECGGHVNPQHGYHYHQAKHCYPIKQQTTDHVGLVGFSRDGYPIFDFDSTIDSLDECDAHSDATRGYHYHLAAPGTNRFIGCYRATPEQGAVAPPLL